MPRYRDRNTGSVINVSEDTAAGLPAHYEPVSEESDTKKTTTARKSSSSNK